MDLFLPPKFSLNSFFVRHVAHPRRMKYISGLNNAQICAVNDVGFINNDQQKAAFPPNNFNETMLRSDSFTMTKREKVVPPNGIWQTFGLIDDTEKWRQQLNSLASSVGLLTQNDIDDYQKKKERKQTMKNLQQKPPASANSVRVGVCTPLKKPGTPSIRYNEPLLTGRKASRQGSRGSRGLSRAVSTGNLTGSKHFIVDQGDRESWMLQVLCQILQTDNLNDVQAWLVSANDSEKERIKQLIDHAMCGLEQSGRIVEQPESHQHKPETPKTGSIVIPEEKKNASSLAYIENALQKIDMNRPNTTPQKTSNANKDSTKLPNILKLDDDYVPPLTPVKRIPATPEAQLASTVLNINMNPILNDTESLEVQKKKTRFAEEAIVKLEAHAAPNKDYSIEKVNLKMTLKDDSNGEFQEIFGNWEQNE